MTIPAEVLAALITGTFVVVAALITAAAAIIVRLVGRKVDKVYAQVTPNGGESAHDQLIQEIQSVERRRERALADHVRRLHPGAQQ